MRYSINFGLLALGTMANAATVKVEVGEGGLAFSPPSVTAAKGDIVEFHFYPAKHSVVQGSFDSPCKVGSVTSGFNSGFVPSTKGEAKEVFQVTINSTDPMWYYCSQVSHCQSGMVGVINPPASGDTLDAYKSAALAVADSDAPTAVTGGVLTTSSGDDSDDDSSTSSSASATSSASGTSSSAVAASTTAASVSSAASSAASSVSKAASSAASSVTSAAVSSTSTPNAAAATGRVSFEMLGLGAVAGGVAMMM